MNPKKFSQVHENTKSSAKSHKLCQVKKDQAKQDACWAERCSSSSDLVPEGHLWLPKRHHHWHVHFMEGKDDDDNEDDYNDYDHSHD